MGHAQAPCHRENGACGPNCPQLHSFVMLKHDPGSSNSATAQQAPCSWHTATTSPCVCAAPLLPPPRPTVQQLRMRQRSQPPAQPIQIMKRQKGAGRGDPSGLSRACAAWRYCRAANTDTMHAQSSITHAALSCGHSCREIFDTPAFSHAAHTRFRFNLGFGGKGTPQCRVFTPMRGG